MIISSHRLNEVSTLVNRVVELDLGKVVLDDKVADDVSSPASLACRIVVVKRAEPAFAKALGPGTFRDRRRPGLGRHRLRPDRLRFHGMVARYVALISDISLNEAANRGSIGHVQRRPVAIFSRPPGHAGSS